MGLFARLPLNQYSWASLTTMEGEEGGKEYESEGEGYAIGVNLNKDQRVERRDRYEMMDRRKADRFSLLPRRRVREREICSPGFS